MLNSSPIKYFKADIFQFNFLAHLSSSSAANPEGRGSGNWKQCPTRTIKVEENSLVVASTMVLKGVYKELVDFDNHLDDVSQDYLNVGLNMEIDGSSD